MIPKLPAGLLVAVAVLAGDAARAQPEPGIVLAAASVSTPEYVERAKQADSFGVNSGRIVAQLGRSTEIRQFAEKMVQNHQDSARVFDAAVLEAGLPDTSPALENEQARKLGALTTAASNAIDELYITQQMEVQKAALALYNAYSFRGDVAPLRAAAGKAVPRIRGYIDELARISEKLERRRD